MTDYKQPEEVALPKPTEYPARRRGKVFGTMMANINRGPNKLSGYPDTDVKRDGVETRGNGAATKGTKARGTFSLMAFKNPEAAKAYYKAWREANKEYRKAYDKARNEANKEQRKARYEANKEYYKAYYEANKEEKLAKKKAYKKANKNIVNANTAKRRAARINRTPGWLTKEDLGKIKEFYKEAHKRKEETGEEWHVDHIIPLQGENISGLHVPDNLQVIRATENKRKHNRYEI